MAEVSVVKQSKQGKPELSRFVSFLHTATYTLCEPVPAVKLGEKGIETIPAGSTLIVEGHCTISGLIDVIWEGGAYALFSLDLEKRSTLVSPFKPS
jgi:hypothetical protein